MDGCYAEGRYFYSTQIFTDANTSFHPYVPPLGNPTRIERSVFLICCGNAQISYTPNPFSPFPFALPRPSFYPISPTHILPRTRNPRSRHPSPERPSTFTPTSSASKPLNVLPSRRYTHRPPFPSPRVTQSYRLGPLRGLLSQICRLGGCLLSTYVPCGGRVSVRTPACWRGGKTE